ncbi:MAG: methyltransferase domain-containing protein [Nitrososphaeraceae archaeon]
MMKIAKTRFKYFVRSDVKSLLLRDNVFDIVFVYNTLHHFPFVNIIREFKRILKSKEEIRIIREL